MKHLLQTSVCKIHENVSVSKIHIWYEYQAFDVL